MNPKDQVKQSLSILDVISTYIKVEKAGSQYKARCPFHNEKTPSFYISLDRGTYHCFGCGEHGDIFSFVEKIESVPFYEALTILADRANVKLTSYNKEKKEAENDLINLLKATNIHYQDNLEKFTEAKVYLAERGLTKESIANFEIGYSVGGNEGFRDLFINLSKAGYSIESMLKSGMIVKKDGEEKYFDRFRGRIMFPIKNNFGNIVGYSARILPKYDDKKVGKYINSPETEIYHKSKILFGYDQAKRSIAKSKEVILVEGQMDMIMSHQVGISNVVATSGTAVTEEQIQIISRFAEKLLLAFDQDEAGETAMKKCASLAISGGLDVYVIPKKEEVKDTADLIKDYGGVAWQELINQRKPLIEYLTEKIFIEVKDSRERNTQVRKEVLPYLRLFNSDMERAYFVNYLANKLNITEVDIINDLKRIKVENNVDKSDIEEKVVVNQNEERLIRIIKNILAILK